MALNALNTLVAQHGFAKLEEAFLLLKEQEEVKARFAAALSKEQGEEVFKALLEAEVPAIAKTTPRRRSTQNSYQLASEEKIEEIIKSINDLQLCSQNKKFSWRQTSRHHPSSERQQEIIGVIRGQEGRSATKQQLMEKLSDKWSWTFQAGHSPADEFIGELVKQGIVIRT